jgi:hypothetical protein
MRRLVLIVFCALAVAAPAAAEKSPKPTTFTAVGTLVARSTTSVSVQAGTATVGCALSKTSPRFANLNVGDRVKLVCSKGFVVSLGKVPDTTAKSDAPKTDPPKTDPPKTDPPKTVTSAVGAITGLSSTSLTVHGENGDLTCVVDATSPKLGDFHVGDSVRLYCVNGVVYQVRSNTTTTTPPPTTPKYTGGLGTISSLSVDRITVSTDGGLVSCYVGTSAPSTNDFHVGDRAKIYCADGVLIALVRA